MLLTVAANAFGVPYYANSQSAPYAPHDDQGAGFHADGTARKVGGENGGAINGKRATAYAGHGLYGMGYREPGFDPATGENYRYANPTSGGRRTLGMGGYGSMDTFDPTRMLLERSLSYGLGLANTVAEELFMGVGQSPYGGTRARLNFMVDLDGKVNGEGDVLVPFYNSKYTTLYTQIGTRSMNEEDSKNRWIGNFGLGQRWYPMARNEGVGEDSGTVMLGYNTFFDNDFTRSHQRGGMGIEGQYDWIHLASNYYFPLSQWKGSKDFDSTYVEERPAQGWDVRAKGYMPFYRNVAVTGAYTQWFGDHVGMFGASRLERDPKVWSYGLEYTPISLVSGFINQRSTERGRSDTEYGLRFTYSFGQSWEEQTNHKKVAEMRTVGGSRNEFVDRENRIILEYRLKEGHKYYVELVEKVGINLFKFRLLDGFGYIAPYRQVNARAEGQTLISLEKQPAPTTFLAHANALLHDLFTIKAAHAANAFHTYTTDKNGEFLVQFDNVVDMPVVIHFQIATTNQTFAIETAARTGQIVSVPATLDNSATATLTFHGRANRNVVWSVASGPGSLSASQNTTDSNGNATATLVADATGFEDIKVIAEVDGAKYLVTVPLNAVYSITSLTVSGGTGAFAASTTATFTAEIYRNGVPAPAGTKATWSVTAADNTANQAVTGDYATKRTGLAWGASAPSAPGTELTASTTSTTNNSGQTLMPLTDVVGERTVTVQVAVGDGSVTRTQDVTYGTGPLGQFRLSADQTTVQYAWSNVIPLSTATVFGAANACGGMVNPLWGPGDYAMETRLPSIAQLRTVSGSTGNNSYKAAGWRDDVDGFWSSQINTDSDGTVVGVTNGRTFVRPLNSQRRVVCQR